MQRCGVAQRRQCDHAANRNPRCKRPEPPEQSRPPARHSDPKRATKLTIRFGDVTWGRSCSADLIEFRNVPKATSATLRRDGARFGVAGAGAGSVCTRATRPARGGECRRGARGRRAGRADLPDARCATRRAARAGARARARRARAARGRAGLHGEGNRARRHARGCSPTRPTTSSVACVDLDAWTGPHARIARHSPSGSRPSARPTTTRWCAASRRSIPS